MQNYCKLARSLNAHNVKVYHIISIPGSGSFDIAQKLISSESVSTGVMNLFESDKYYADIPDLEIFDKKIGKLWNIMFREVEKIERMRVYVLRDWSNSFTCQEFSLLSSLKNWSFIFVDRIRAEQKLIYKELMGFKNDIDFEEKLISTWDNYHYFKHICIRLHIKFILVKYEDINWDNIYSFLRIKKSEVDNLKVDKSVKLGCLTLYHVNSPFVSMVTSIGF